MPLSTGVQFGAPLGAFAQCTVTAVALEGLCIIPSCVPTMPIPGSKGPALIIPWLDYCRLLTSYGSVFDTKCSGANIYGFTTVSHITIL